MSKYKKTGGSGIVYDTMEDAHEDYCIGRRCEDCPLDLPSKMADEQCNVWAKMEPERAAELMGIEIVQEEPEPDPTANPAQESETDEDPEEPMETYECQNCGGEIEAHQAIFCPWCGLRFDEMDKKKSEIAQPNVRRHWNICWELNELYERKNHDYGDSFHQSFVEEGMAMARIRLGDKLSRFKMLTRNGGQQVADESIRDTLIDLANYAIMTVMEMEEQGT